MPPSSACTLNKSRRILPISLLLINGRRIITLVKFHVSLLPDCFHLLQVSSCLLIREQIWFPRSDVLGPTFYHLCCHIRCLICCRFCCSIRCRFLLLYQLSISLLDPVLFLLLDPVLIRLLHLLLKAKPVFLRSKSLSSEKPSSAAVYTKVNPSPRLIFLMYRPRHHFSVAFLEYLVK